MRTPQEIVARINERKDDDAFGFEWTEYLLTLPYEDAKQFLNAVSDMSAEKWNEARTEPSKVAMVAKMLDYMPFAWEKANDQRGISASRSIMHFIAWTWLAGDDELSKELEKDYVYYGKPHLIKICEHYGWNFTPWDDGSRTNG